MGQTISTWWHDNFDLMKDAPVLLIGKPLQLDLPADTSEYLRFTIRDEDRFQLSKLSDPTTARYVEIRVDAERGGLEKFFMARAGRFPSINRELWPMAGLKDQEAIKTESKGDQTARPSAAVVDSKITPRQRTWSAVMSSSNTNDFEIGDYYIALVTNHWKTKITVSALIHSRPLQEQKQATAAADPPVPEKKSAEHVNDETKMQEPLNRELKLNSTLETKDQRRTDTETRTARVGFSAEELVKFPPESRVAVAAPVRPQVQLQTQARAPSNDDANLEI